jgi:hypothetical protein
MLALKFSLSHVRALYLKSELKCSKVFRALKFRGGDPNRPYIMPIQRVLQFQNKINCSEICDILVF